MRATACCRLTAVLWVAMFCLLAWGDLDLGRTLTGSVHTKVYSGAGTWAGSAGDTALTVTLGYDAKGALVGTATAVAAARDVPVKGSLRIVKKKLTLALKSAEKGVTFTASAVVDPVGRTFTGKATVVVPDAGISERKAAFTGTMPGGTGDELGFTLDLAQSAKRKLTGTATLTSPWGAARGPFNVKGALVISRKGKATVNLTAARGVLVLKGNVVSGVFVGTISAKVPGLTVAKLPVRFLVSDFAMVLDQGLSLPFATSVSPLPVGGTLIDVGGAGLPATISFVNGGQSGTLNVAPDGTFGGTVPLAPGDNDVVLAILRDAPALAHVVATHNPGFDFAGRLRLTPDIAYVGTGRQLTGTIAITAPALDAGTVALIDADTGDTLAMLVDSGSLAAGDEIEGDGTFSGLVWVAEAAEGARRVRVRLTHDGGTEALSEVAQVRITQPVTQADLDLMASTQDAFQAEMDALTDPAEIAAKVDEILAALAGADGVAASGPSDSGLGVWILYDSGLLGVIYSPAAGNKGGHGDDAAPNARGGGRVVTGPEPAPSAYNGHYPAGFPRSRAFRADEADLVKSSKVYAIAAQYFDWGEGDDVPAMQQTLRNATCYDVTYVTYGSRGSGSVEDFKSFGNYGIVLISSHGDSFFAGIPGVIQQQFGWNYPFGQVVMHTNARYDANSAATYQDDLKAGRLVRWGGHFGVLPSFIRTYSGPCPNSLVYMSICRGAWNGSMARAFLDLGAGAYLGYSDYVAVGFTQTNGTKTLAELLAPDGSLQTGWQPGIVETDKDPAEYRLFGNRDLSIQNTGLKDGGFESGQVSQAWSRSGDGRIIVRLGASVPTEGTKMGIISTGLGFTTSNGLVRQQFCMPANADTISFDWNFFSEEFMEYVGSIYQDGFTVTLAEPDGANSTLLFSQTVDSIAANYPPSKVSNSFDRGDVYATGWKTFTTTVPAALVGKPVVLTFSTFDVGDSAYDTAVLLDDVRITTTSP